MAPLVGVARRGVCTDPDAALGGGFQNSLGALGSGTTWDVGLDAGVGLSGGGQADAVEWGVALDDLNLDSGEAIRATFYSTVSDLAGSDVMVVTNTNVAGAPADIPTLGQWGMILLALLLAGLAYPSLRRHTGGLAALVVSAAGASLLLGGVTMMDSRANGSGFPLGGLLSVQELPMARISSAAVSVTGRASPQSPPTPRATATEDDDAEDMVAGFIARDANNLYFRVDVVDTEQILFR
ncbi:MAG: IPTL-CTERM sorting domain-containing protein [Arhodomonas sp.]|nr:IPTL-CTERM sorting domain-containing protein [Arhodomonas sp.]